MSAAVATLIALVSVAKQRVVAKKKAAHDFMLTIWERDHVEAESVFRELVNNDRLVDILEAKTTTEIEQRIKVQRYLNRFEILAVSIKANIIDEHTCKSVIVDHVVFAYEKAKPLIDKLIELHDGDEEFFCHLKELAEKWMANPTPEDSGFWLWVALKEIPKM